ncbi:MAG: nucleotide sugar dehydrogenase [Sandaracinaceae bacterium]|nr:nucleotide sugar dehydrogenase [Sandaracinaceae bacterium]MDW8245693.1 nucleotide sugar dehydrogenase [Sandaracinaceae bacterium]
MPRFEDETIGVIGLGYVGLPVALAFGRAYEHVVGFDVNPQRIAELKAGYDRTHEVGSESLANTTVHFTHDPKDLEGLSFYVVTVPTPIYPNRQPDLRPLEAASRTVGRALRKLEWKPEGPLVVYESTVYPGLTEEFCAPILEEVSGLVRGRDFKLGYSPERINPGDKEHTLERTVKVVAGEDAEALERVARAYGRIVEAGVFRARSIQVAEAAKVIENTQRDLNIALMNELALIFDRMGIRTRDVLDAASTKWNFLRFEPGLVGGHCIGVDPYYLTAKAESLGYHPQVILAGRRINDGMGVFVAQKLIKLLIAQDIPVKRARVAILGLTFKENIPDIRNSRVPDIVTELRAFGIDPLITDPRANPEEVQKEYGLTLVPIETISQMDAIIVAVAHKEYRNLSQAELKRLLRENGILLDVKSIFAPESIPGSFLYWSL